MTDNIMIHDFVGEALSISPHMYYFVRKVSDLIFFCENLMDFNKAHLHEATLEPSYAFVNFAPPDNSISWLQAAFEWGSV